jgi:SHS2 domain-containing protein
MLTARNSTAWVRSDPVMPYAFFPHTGDIGVRLRGASLAELAESAAQAFADVVTDPAGIREVDAAVLTARAAAPDLLLREFLNELLFQFDARRRLVASATVSVTRQGDLWLLEAATRGEAWDPDRHPVKVLVKAITYHALSACETPEGWMATVVFDI